MCIALIGGREGLDCCYREAAQRDGVSLEIFTSPEEWSRKQPGSFAGMVILPGRASPQLWDEALDAATAGNIPVFIHHSSDSGGLRECLSCIRIIHAAKG